MFPRRETRDTAAGRAVVERRIIHIPDLREDPEYGIRWVQQALGYHTVLAVPMLRDGEAIGVLNFWRREVRSFTDKQIALVTTFADQAVIAIENVRLFRNLTEALEQQTATSEILKVISSSPTDAQPVFETIARSATVFCGAATSGVFRFDGERLHIVADYNFSPEAAVEYRRVFPMVPSRANVTGRAVLDRAVIHLPDIEQAPEFTISHQLHQVLNFRSLVSVPLLRDGTPIGAITVARAEQGPFAADQIALLQTFADQAVIAIENVRLFTELQEKNSALTEAHAQVTEALEQQTATSEILAVISSSPTDVQPVFETIVERAGRLCDATWA